MNIFSAVRFKIVIHIILGLFLGIAIGLAYLSTSQTFQQYLAGRIAQQFQADYGYQLNAKLESIDWVSCSVNFSEVAIHPIVADKEPSWSIVAEKLEVKGSWLHLFLHRRLKISLFFSRVIMHEVFEQTPQELATFCSKMFIKALDSFIVYDVIAISDGLLFCKRLSDDFNVQMPFVCNMRTEKLATRMQLYLHDGSVGLQNRNLVKNISGSILADLPFVNPFTWLSGQIQLNYNVVKSEQEIPGFLAGKLQRGVGQLSLKTQDGSIVIDPIKINCTSTACWCEIMIAATTKLLQHFDMDDLFHDLDGAIGLSLQCDLYHPLETLQASIVLGDIFYKSKSILPDGKIVIMEHGKHGFSGVFQVQNQKKFAVDFSMIGDCKKCKFYNLVDLQHPFDKTYTILKDQCQIDATYDKSGVILGNYHVEIYHQIFKESYPLVGTFTLQDGILSFSGKIVDIDFVGSVRLFPDYQFQSFTVSRNGSLLAELHTDATDAGYVVGSVDFSLLHSILSDPFKMSFAQEGSFVFRGRVKDGICSATVQTHYAHIRVPYVYNVIQNIAATCEFHIHEKNLVFKDIDVELYEGKISCKQAQVYFDKNFEWYFVHGPFMFDKVMFSWNKGIYGLVSGRILLSKVSLQDPLNIQGQLMMQNAELKENIFAAEFQNILSGFASSGLQAPSTIPAAVDISLFTQDPLQIKTSFLTAKALLNLRVQGMLAKTELSGAIKILSGTLHFPYKPLEIIEGKLLFVPEQQLSDPVIEFVAKGKLKRFGVTLKAWGSALDPHIQFEAEPYLSEEQIVSLLLLGIEDQSLSLMVPAFLTQRLKDIIFGPALSNVTLKSVFDTLLQSLKYVRFIPQFTNQTGRGGVRGIFEIDATEHLQGKIDTNFSHLEDTKFDVDYSATDDVTLRLQKDGPSTYGGQVEFRWKFS
jgi:hypothetical protein